MLLLISILVERFGCAEECTTDSSVHKNGVCVRCKDQIFKQCGAKSAIQGNQINAGVIVNVIANMWNGFPTMAHTGAARAGVDNLTKSLAVGAVEFTFMRVTSRELCE